VKRQPSLGNKGAPLQDEFQYGSEGLGRQQNVVTKFAFATRVGYVPNNPHKVNQDSFILAPNLLQTPSIHFFGVADGHGQYGREVSSFVKVALPQKIEHEIKVNKSEIDQALTTAFLSTNQLIARNVPDPQFSGTTCCTLLLNGTKIKSANTGDSRAILVSKDGKGTPLSTDHKPEDPEEAKRIIASGGRIAAFKDHYGEDMGPKRVWLLHEDVPGLAMSRSLGDYKAQSVGVSCIPEIQNHQLNENHAYIVIASDGVWEFLSNQDVANITFPFYKDNSPEAAANALVKESYKKWKQEEEVIDDITCVIVYFDFRLIK